MAAYGALAVLRPARQDLIKYIRYGRIRLPISIAQRDLHIRKDHLQSFVAVIDASSFQRCCAGRKEGTPCQIPIGARRPPTPMLETSRPPASRGSSYAAIPTIAETSGA